MARNVDGLFIVPRRWKTSSIICGRSKNHWCSSTGILALLTTRWLRVITRPGDELARNMLAERKTPLWFLVGDTALPSITDRLNGYLQALKTAGIHHREWVIEGPDNTPEGGYALMDSLIDSRGVPQAFIASSLPVLEGAIEALRTRTGTVPQHINIGTFDEHPMLGFLPNSVWSMQQDEDTWAEKAFELMQRAIDGEAVNETAKVDMKLVKRSRQ